MLERFYVLGVRTALEKFAASADFPDLESTGYPAKFEQFVKTLKGMPKEQAEEARQAFAEKHLPDRFSVNGEKYIKGDRISAPGTAARIVWPALSGLSGVVGGGLLGGLAGAGVSKLFDTDPTKSTGWGATIGALLGGGGLGYLGHRALQEQAENAGKLQLIRQRFI